MRRFRHLLVALPLALFAGTSFAGEAIVGRPTVITDGDTIRFGSLRVRIAGIDAPEISTSYGPASREYLAQLVGSDEVRCVDTGQRSYDRIVARCQLRGGQDVASAMVAGGWAFDWPSYSRGAYKALELQARASRRGIFRATPFARREDYHPRGPR